MRLAPTSTRVHLEITSGVISAHRAARSYGLFYSKGQDLSIANLINSQGRSRISTTGRRSQKSIRTNHPC